MVDPASCWACLAIDYLLWIDGYRITIPTNNPCHLWCYWTDVKPRRHRATARIRGKLVPWGAYFCFVSWHKVEQNEPDDTLIHTFDLFEWPACQTRYFTFAGTVAQKDSPSIAPLFDAHYAGSYLIIKNPSFEQWRPTFDHPEFWDWTDLTTFNVLATPDTHDYTHGKQSLRMITNGYIPWRRLYQDIDATPYRGMYIWIRPDIKGAPIYYTGFSIYINGTPPYSHLAPPASPDYWSHYDIFRKVPPDATLIRVYCNVDSFLHTPNICRFDNIRSVAIPG